MEPYSRPSITDSDCVLIWFKVQQSTVQSRFTQLTWYNYQHNYNYNHDILQLINAKYNNLLQHLSYYTKRVRVNQVSACSMYLWVGFITRPNVDTRPDGTHLAVFWGLTSVAFAGSRVSVLSSLSLPSSLSDSQFSSGCPCSWLSLACRKYLRFRWYRFPLTVWNCLVSSAAQDHLASMAWVV